jgi:hypothetical protein
MSAPSKAHEILDLIHDITTGKCVLSDKNHLYKVFGKETFEDMVIQTFVSMFMKNVQAEYLNSYEVYLIYKIKSSDEPAKAQYIELLKDYFRFIVSLDLEPFFKKKTDLSESQVIVMYTDIADHITVGKVDSVKKEVTDIIKSKTEDVIRKLLNLFNMDEAFKQSIFVND